MLRPVLVTGPAELPVTLAEAKSQMRVSHDLEDTLITSYVQAATSHLDGHSGILGRALVTQTWSVSAPDFASDKVYLPLPDVSSVVVTYYDEDNAEQTVSSSNYRLLEDAFGAFIEFDSDYTSPSVYDRSDAVKYTFVCGYGDAEDVPQPIKQAIQLLAGHWYKVREAIHVGMGNVSEVPMAVNALISPYRRVGS